MEFRIQDISDSTLAFNFSNSIDERVNKHINLLSESLISEDLDLLSIYPTYTSLIVTYNPLLIKRVEIIKRVEKLNKTIKSYEK